MELQKTRIVEKRDSRLTKSLSFSKFAWSCRSCGIHGIYRSSNPAYCGGAYFGWLIGATPTEGRTCCNCVVRVTGSDVGYIGWACSNCKVRKNALASKDYNDAGFETGMSRFPLNETDGMKWLHSDDDEQSGMMWLRGLEHLNLESVNFKSFFEFLPENIACYSSLISINVSNNKYLTSLPIKNLCQLTLLEEVECTGCPSLLSPPPEVCFQGGKAVMNFLREVNSNGQPNKSITIFLIGDGESGKTSILSALRSSNNTSAKIHIDSRTVGIDISTWNLRETKDIEYVVYDMAGQSVYRDTHTFFVGRRALYLFIWKLRKNFSDIREMNEMVDSWIDTLQFKIPASSILVIATHAACVDDVEKAFQVNVIKDLIMRKVQMSGNSDYAPLSISQSGESHVVDSTTGYGVASLRAKIIAFSKSLPWYGELLPNKWIELNKRLQQLRNDGTLFLNWSSYIELGKQCNLENDNLKSATVFLHEDAKIRYFGYSTSLQYLKDDTPPPSSTCSCFSMLFSKPVLSLHNSKEKSIDEYLLDTVYISPSWICDVMKGIIRHDRDTLLRYFNSSKQVSMAQKVRRIISLGSLHHDLVDYMWPCSGEGEIYWQDDATIGERFLWSKNVVNSSEDISRALSVLIGCDLIFPIDHGYLVPMLIKRGNHVRTSDALSVVPCTYMTTFQLSGIPSGFFERIATRISKSVFHIDVGSNQAICYAKGNIGHLLAYKKNSKSSKVILSTKASSLKLWKIMLHEIEVVSSFFPGLSKKIIHNTDTRNIIDPLQVLIISCDRKFGHMLRDRLRQNDEDLHIAIMSGSGQHQYPRIVIVCIDTKIAQNQSYLSLLQKYHDLGCIIIPVLSGGYKVVDYVSWWPKELEVLSLHKLFIDLRSQIAYKIDNELFPQVTLKLNQWRGFQNKVLVSRKLHCPECIKEGVQNFFDAENCLKNLLEWQDQKLLAQHDSSELLVKCPQSHEVSVSELVSQTVVMDMIPCPICISVEETNPHLFDREKLLCIFDDDNEQKQGIVICPKCTEKNRDRHAVLNVLDIVNTDIFISYNWGYEKSTQNFIKPLVRKIELQTDLVCWFDVGGGLFAGEDFEEKMMNGIEKSAVFLAFLSDAYFYSKNCMIEFCHAILTCKFIVPILLPDSKIQSQKYSMGWTGKSSEKWWKHASMLSKLSGVKVGSINWSSLDVYVPIEVTSESLLNVSCDEIVCRIMSRILRVSTLSVKSLFETNTPDLTPFSTSESINLDDEVVSRIEN